MAMAAAHVIAISRPIGVIVAAGGLAGCITIATLAAPAPLPAENAGWEPVVNGLVSVFSTHDFLLLGEAHGRRVDADLRVRLVRDPVFQKSVQFIVVERADSSAQAALDRYVSGSATSDAELQPFAFPPEYQELFAAIRESNQALPSTQRMRVLAGRELQGRDGVLTTIRDQVIARKRKALVIYGSGHVWRARGDVAIALARLSPGRVFVAELLTAFAPRARDVTPPEYVALKNALTALELTLRTKERPVLVSLEQNTRAARLVADPFYLGQAMLGPDVTLGQNDDAVVFFGVDPQYGAFMR